MSCCIEIEEIEKNQSTLILNGIFRFLLGFILLAAGVYVATMSEMRGHGLGYLLILGAPFFMVDDE